MHYDWVLGPREGGSFSLWLKATTQHTLELFTEKVMAGSYDSVSIGKHPIRYYNQQPNFSTLPIIGVN